MKEYFKSLMIEPTNICNLHCPVCGAGTGRDTRLKGSMKFGQFKKIIDSTNGLMSYIDLWGNGEPFLVPDIMKMIHYAGRNIISVNVHTNGCSLNKKILNQFKDNKKGRVEISFSIDGLTQETYGYYRQGGNLKKAMDNLSFLVALKERYGLHNIKIIWQFLVMRANEHEAPDVYKMAVKMKVDDLRLKTINIAKGHPRYNDFIPKNKNFRRIKRKNFAQCSFLFNPGQPVVLWNGDVVPCCQLYSTKSYCMGNVFKKNLLDIWNNRRYNIFRNDYKDGKNNFCNTRCGQISRKTRIVIGNSPFVRGRF